MTSLNTIFTTALQKILDEGIESSPRGLPCKELLTYTFRLKNPRNRIITIPARELKYRYLLAEFIWYLSGNINVDSIAKYAPFWMNIADANDTVNSNYGFRLYGYAPEPIMPFNQWERVKQQLVDDPDTRQAVMHINLPYDYTFTTNKDVPCTLNLQWLIRNKKLYLCVSMRSNDIILGFCNDVFQFTMMQEMMLMELRNNPKFSSLELGEYYHVAHSLHLYSPHYTMAKYIIEQHRLDKDKCQDIVMFPMDLKDDTRDQLIDYEQCWRLDHDCAPSKYVNPTAYDSLPSYWQRLIGVCFGKLPIGVIQEFKE